MTFSANMPAAARRHLLAAKQLDTSDRRDVAGYLYGIAAECGVKAMMLEAGIKPSPSTKASNDPFFLHFPDLRTVLRDRLQGHRGTPLTNLLKSDSFMSNWSIKMRYCHGREIENRWIDIWAKQAVQVVSAIGT